MTSRFVRTRVHITGRIPSQGAGGQTNRTAAQDGMAATGTAAAGGSTEPRRLMRQDGTGNYVGS